MTSHRKVAYLILLSTLILSSAASMQAQQMASLSPGSISQGISAVTTGFTSMDGVPAAPIAASCCSTATGISVGKGATSENWKLATDCFYMDFGNEGNYLYEAQFADVAVHMTLAQSLGTDLD
jgi:hypothetical protein